MTLPTEYYLALSGILIICTIPFIKFTLIKEHYGIYLLIAICILYICLTQVFSLYSDIGVNSVAVQIGYLHYYLIPVILLSANVKKGKDLNIFGKYLKVFIVMFYLTSLMGIFTQITGIKLVQPLKGTVHVLGNLIPRNTGIVQVESTALATVALVLLMLQMSNNVFFVSKKVDFFLAITIILSTFSKPLMFLLPIVFLFILFTLNGRKIILILLCGLVLGIMLVLYIHYIEGTVMYFIDAAISSGSARVEKWINAKNLLTENIFNFMFGYGFRTPQLFFKEGFHSYFVQTWFEFGLLTFVILFIIVKYIYTILHKTLHNTVYLMLALLVIFCTFFTTELVNNKLFAFFIFFIVPCFLYNSRQKQASKSLHSTCNIFNSSDAT